MELGKGRSGSMGAEMEVKVASLLQPPKGCLASVVTARIDISDFYDCCWLKVKAQSSASKV